MGTTVRSMGATEFLVDSGAATAGSTIADALVRRYAMKKTALFVGLAVVLALAVNCSNYNKMTPAPLDNKAIQAEVEKNLAADGLTGIVHVSEVHEGVVTLTGTVKTAADRQKAYDDAAKVNGVKSVINEVKVGS
jgi:osmotically-inducible protein OsmY